MRKIILVCSLFSLFLILPLAVKGEGQQGSLYEKFLEKWELYFGKAPEVQLNFDKMEQFPEVQFRKIWEAYSKYIPLEERDSAEGAFRYHLLKDKRLLINSLNACFYSSRLFPQKNGGILFYLFAEEEISEPSVIPQILPPGESGSKFIDNLVLFGESETKIRTRLAAFILEKMVENRILRQAPNSLPVMLTLTKRLKDSEFAFARISASSEYFIKGEIKGDSKNIKVISLFMDRAGKTEKIAVSDGGNSLLLMPSQNGTLYLFLFNASSEEQSDLISATFWKDYNPPVSIASAKIEGNFINLSLDESAGILGYEIEVVSGKGEKSAVSSHFTKSLGSGVN
ncbi:MAG: hypothetical protein N2445_05635, partial [Acidobacteria bacterium]|nr:hypothetical protein [Acidobacteriota bacterium]